MARVCWSRPKKAAERAREGCVGCIRLERITSCGLATVVIGTRLRSNVPGAPSTPRMRIVQSSVEGDRRASSRRHPPSCATRQPAWGKANESRIGDTAKRATGGKLGSSFPNWAAWGPMLWNISFLDFRNANGCGAPTRPLKHCSSTPLHYPLKKAKNVVGGLS